MRINEKKKIIHVHCDFKGMRVEINTGFETISWYPYAYFYPYPILRNIFFFKYHHVDSKNNQTIHIIVNNSHK